MQCKKRHEHGEKKGGLSRGLEFQLCIQYEERLQFLYYWLRIAMLMTAIAATGYALAAALFAVLAVLLATSWRGHRAGTYLMMACLASVIWGFVLAWNLGRSPLNPLLIFIVEILRTTAWVGFLVYLVGRIGVSLSVRVSALVVCALVFLGGMAGWVEFRWFGGLGDIGRILFPGGLAIALVGLLLVEQLYRNSPIESRWGLKSLVLGLGGIFAYDLFLYSQSVLFNGIDSTAWAARGAVNVLFVPAIAIAARRNPDWELRIFVSRQVVFYTTTLVAVGLYLLLMSLGGYLLLQFGGSWGALVRSIFFVGAGFVLITLLFSSVLRARVKVFLNKHFFHNKYDYREEWLRLVSTLSDFDADAANEVPIKAIAQIVDSPSGALWIMDEREKRFVLNSTYELSMGLPDIAKNDAVIEFMQRENWLIDIDEYSRAPDRYKNLELSKWLIEIEGAWLLVPLTSEHRLLGVILLTVSPGRPILNYEDRDLLKTVGNHIAVHLAQSRSDGLLSEAQQFETYNKLTAFLMHDLNNLIAQQSLIVANAEKHKRNPEFVDDAISTISGSVERMKNVMSNLRRGEQSKPGKLVEIRFLASAAVDRCAVKLPVPKLDSGGVTTSVSVNAEELIMVLTHLIRNAQDATSDDGEVFVSVRTSGEVVEIIIRDTGSGMTQEFIRNRMFRPFDSTKGSQGMGIGAYQAREFARGCGGDMVVASTPNEGTTVILSVPAAN